MLRLFLTLCVLTILAGCTSTVAPVVEGWKQSPRASDYRVQADDSLYSIAWAFALDYRQLASWNHLKEPYHLRAGQMLRMSPPTGQTQHAVVAQPQPIAARPSTPSKSTPAKIVAATKLNWVWPTKGRVVRGFSLAGGNKGLDIAGQIGQPVVAASAGKVVYAGASLPGYGNLIIIKHSDNELSAYAYNKVITVKEGQVVQAGQPIAQMGKNDKGSSMLHFEIRQNGKPVDPRGFLR